MSRVLIVGGSGFIGLHRVQHLRKLKHQVIAVSRARNTGANYSYVEDISEPHSLDYILSRKKIDFIENYASVSTVSASRKNPYYTFKVNVLGTLSVLELAKEFNIPVLQFTSDKVYGHSPEIPLDEGMFLIPQKGSYEMSKTMQDLLAQSYKLEGVNVTIVRSANVFGKYDMNSRIIPNTIDSLKNGLSPIIFSNVKSIRQYIYVQDLMNALDLILEKAKGEIVNIGTDEYLAQESVVQIITKLWNEKHHTNIQPKYEERPNIQELAVQLLNWEKLKSLGFKPKYTFEQGIGEMI